MKCKFQGIFDNLNKEQKKSILFFLVGGINTFFGYSIYAILLFFKFHYSLAALISTISGVLFNFKTTGFIVFQNTNNRLLFRFICIYTITYLLNIGCLKVFSFFNANMYFAGAILILPMALIAYTLQRKFVFMKG